MAELAIKGHETRGKEVIELLEMMGGVNKHQIDAIRQTYVYFIDTDGIIRLLQIDQLLPEKDIVYSLEEFLEKYPYKVGDKVEFESIGDANLKSKIIYMEWCNSLNKVLYTTEDAQVISTEDIIETKSIPLYMDYDIKEDKDMSKHTSEINLNHPCFDGHDKIELIIPENWKFEQRGNKMFGIRKYPQYPTTYGKCCDILGYDPCEDEINCYKGGFIESFVRLLICRDAYWKIAGEQMGLDKPWNPDYDSGVNKYGIIYMNGVVQKSNPTTNWERHLNKVLDFPTAEMRDAFYENFKELINKVKELL